MKKLGNIRLAVASDKYQVQFQYATPQKIDFFALTLMEIIKRKQQFRGKNFSEVLLMLEIPEDLHNIFEDRLKTLINDYPEMVSVEYDEKYFLESDTSYYNLTNLGEQTYISKEIIEETKSFSDEFIYEHNNQLLNVRNSTIQPENEALVIDTRANETDDILIERFSKIIANQITKFIPTANSKTRVFDMQIAPTNTVHLRDNVEVNLENGIITFTHKSKTILDFFLKLPKSEKESIRSKMFLYLNVPYNQINKEMAAIATPRSQPLKMRVIFGNEKVLTKEIYEKGIFEWNDTTVVYNIPNEKMYVFAGLTNNGKTLVFKYSEINEEGFTIPLVEEDYSYQNYVKVFNDVLEQYQESLSDDYTIQFILTIAPKEKSKEIIKLVADKNNNSNEIVNKLLSINEATTIEALELIEHYNQLLEQGKIRTISHKSNLFAAYSDYSKQLEKLKTLGFENYYSYSLPKDWNVFRKEILILKTLFDKLKDKLTEQHKKQASDFFTKSEEDFYDLAPIDEQIEKELVISDDWRKDINKALNVNKSNFQAIAAVIRGKFEGQIRKSEKQKDANSNGARKGKELIDFVLSDYEDRKNVYNSWRNLNALVHYEASPDHFLIKGNDKERKDAINKAINCFNQILDEKKENPKIEKGTNNPQSNKKKK